MASPTYAQRRAFYTALDVRELKNKQDEEDVKVVVGEVEASDVPGQEQDAGSNSGPLILKSYLSPFTSYSDCLNAADTPRLEKAGSERDALRHLNERGCTHVPTLISEFEHHEPQPGGCRTKHYILMTKVPGVTLQHAYHELSTEERDSIRAAFLVALKAVHDRGYCNGSYHLGNVIWCKKENKCYIVDFERAILLDEGTSDRCCEPSEWGMY